MTDGVGNLVESLELPVKIDVNGKILDYEVDLMSILHDELTEEQLKEKKQLMGGAQKYIANEFIGKVMSHPRSGV